MSIEAMKQVLDDAADQLRSLHAENEGLRQAKVALRVINGEICYKSNADDQSYGMWCPVMYDSEHCFPNGTEFYTR